MGDCLLARAVVRCSSPAFLEHEPSLTIECNHDVIEHCNAVEHDTGHQALALLLASPYNLASVLIVVVCDDRATRERATPDVATWLGLFCFALWRAKFVVHLGKSVQPHQLRPTLARTERWGCERIDALHGFAERHCHTHVVAFSKSSPLCVQWIYVPGSAAARYADRHCSVGMHGPRAS